MNLDETRGNPLVEALKALQKRDYLRGELASKLAARGYGPDEIQSAIDRCSQWGFLDDSRTGVDLAESLWSRGYGRLRIRHDLERRGAPSEVVEAVVSLFDSSAEASRAQEIITKRFRPSDPPAKAARYLGNRGFEDEIIAEVIESFFEAAYFE